MLCLKFKLGEELCIGNEIVVKVLEINKSEVRLGVQAPANIEVDRKVVRERKLTERTLGDKTYHAHPLRSGVYKDPLED